MRRIGQLLATAITATALAAPLGAQAQAPARPVLAVLPFGFLDTTGEPRDQRAEHDARLAALGEQLRAGLGGSYRIVAVADLGVCPAGDSACILEHAHRSGAEIVLTGAVQKVSTMMTRMWVGAFDVSTGKRVFYRDLNFRGDTDEAYRRATAFLIDEIESKPLRAP